MTNISTHSNLVINPALQLIRSTNDEVIVRFGSRGRSSRRVSDDTKRGILSDIVFSFSEGANRSTVEDRFGEASHELITALLDSSILIPSQEADFGFLAAGYGNLSPNIDTLTVIGQGVFADECARLLKNILADKVKLSLRSSVEPDVDPDELTVCVSDSPNIGLFYDMNEYALTYNAAWHGGYLDGPELVVGPLFIPGETGCFHDFDAMEEAGRSMKLDYLFMKMNGASALPSQVPEYVASLAASYLTSSVLQHILGVGSHLEGHFLRIDLDRLEVVRQRATRLARCPACSENRPDIRSPFL